MPTNEPQGTQSQTGQSNGEGSDDANLEKKIGDIVNRAISARNKEVDKKIEKAFEGFATNFSATLDEKLSALKGAPPPDGGTVSPDKIAEHPVVKGMAKKLEEQSKIIQQTQQAAQAERDNARNLKLRQRTTEELGKHGIDASRVEHALAFLNSKQLVRYADETSDDIVFHDVDGSEVDLTSGLKAWAKGDDAKIYLPPRGATGSGDLRGGKRPTGPGANPAPQPGQLGRMLLGMAGHLPQLDGGNGTSEG